MARTSGGTPSQTGVVKWFNADKGFGFITPHGSAKDVFVHYTGITGDGYRKLQDGQEVSFEVTDTPKGKQAVNVRAL